MLCITAQCPANGADTSPMERSDLQTASGWASPA